MGELRQREPRYENRKLLDLAHKVDRCQNCGSYPDSGCEPAHEEGLAAGKAMSTKSHDYRHAALCHACHVWYDSIRHGRDPSGDWSAAQRAFMFDRARERTFDIYWRNGWLKVT